MEIRVAGIEKDFGATAALRGVTLEVKPGELLALLGPSGSGKTTLLRVIAGLEIADAGEVLFGGEDATDIAVQDRRVGFVFQHYALFRHLTVAGNIAYGLKARPRGARPLPAEIAHRVAELLALVQLEGFERRYPAQLSGGQRQRVALARALAVEPRVLLLDEPFGALDAKVRKDLRRWLRDIHERTGQTTIFVTHDQEEALELADRVAILDDGRIAQVGTPDEVYDQPATGFVMQFLGLAVTIPALVQDGQVFVGRRPVPVAPPPGHAGPIDLLCRPWDFELAPDPESASLTGAVRAVRRLGSLRRIEVDLDGGPRIEVEAPAGTIVIKGNTIGLAIARAQVASRRTCGYD